MLTIESIRREVSEVAPDYAIERIVLFGSIARGDSDETSDVDLMLDTSEGFSLLDAVRLSQDLSERLNAKTDIVGTAILKRRSFKDSIERDGKVVYERAS